MALVFTKKVAPGVSLGLWQIAEDEPFFREKMPLSADEDANLNQLKDELRRLEWLACRWLLHELTGHAMRLPLAKDAFSKPFFPENAELACSLSHSRGVVAALLVEAEPSAVHRPPSAVGCDLQKIVPKMLALAPKFMRLEEAAFVQSQPEATRLDWLHFFWTAKESLYKAWGKKSLDFRAHIRVAAGPDTAHGFVEKDATRLTFQIFSEKINVPGSGDFVLTWCLG